MNILISPNSDPYQNLATEEFLLKNCTEDFIFLYINRPCVVVGKHQIVPKEINSSFTFEDNILITRRLSGGGTVYHDEGNLNISFIQSVPPSQNISYRVLSAPVSNFLTEKGFPVLLSERNDFILSGRKVSGSAMHVYKNRLLAHCTLLVDSDLNRMSSALRSGRERFIDKSISSRRSEVINLSELNRKITIHSVLTDFVSYIGNTDSGINFFEITESMKLAIHQLSLEKYSSADWIYGYSPKYVYQSSLIEDGLIEYSLDVDKGTIKNVAIKTKDKLSVDNKQRLNMLLSRKHNIFDLTEFFKSEPKSKIDTKLLASLF
jgi:lipoate-protein ligase A